MSILNCSDENKLKFLLFKSFASNNSMWAEALSNVTGSDCNYGNYSNLKLSPHLNLQIEDVCKVIYAILTPIIVSVGTLGNILSLTVFLSKFMRRLSSSCYLTTLSICHILILITYVLFDWLHRGLGYWPGYELINLMSYRGVCHSFLYISYTLRFTSVWLIVAFAVERYVAICHPRYRRLVCGRSFAKKVTLTTIVCAGLFCVYKPALSVVYQIKNTRLCVANPEYRQLNFIMDSVYVIMITALPSSVISTLSVLILRRLRAIGSAQNAQRLVFKEHRLRIELTVILLAIAWCFILLTLPYFVTWCLQFFHSFSYNTPFYNGNDPFLLEVFSGHVAITRTIYYLNYATNFFLYCLTGAHYRRQVRGILRRNSCQTRLTGLQDNIKQQHRTSSI
ncbi:hypothetical protein LSH36_1677g00002 [Paralvinella palmiformis]|uniref:G-protein coupled receptors family 1 profile domain-containing protein n=1 Tax=Paralvinella palmiformis TaxID=53620 RepID=A0AAD9IRQ6_9ANNE|nr:hypothetical protein LSH36_1677g00002 [Paralvinella palmiformis]